MLQIPDVLEFSPSTIPTPIIEDMENKKSLFGVELGKGEQAFQAALNVCGQNTKEALFISQRWLNDPIVVASKDVYLKTVHNSNSLLDAEELAARLLEMAEERNASNTFYMLEGKDRLKALELYAKIRGYDKSSIVPTQQNFIHNQMTIKLVEPEKKEIIERVIQEPEVVQSVSPIKLKLVG